jgi:hypothetical protein
VEVLIWVNTIAILFALVGGGIIVLYQLRKISEALVQIAETVSRSERISVAILQRLSVGDTPQV